MDIKGGFITFSYVSYLENPCQLPHPLLLYANCMTSRRSEMRDK